MTVLQLLGMGAQASCLLWQPGWLPSIIASGGRVVILASKMSVRMRWALAVIGLVIIFLALVGLAYSLWPLDGTKEQFTLPVELAVFLWG